MGFYTTESRFSALESDMLHQHVSAGPLLLHVFLTATVSWLQFETSLLDSTKSSTLDLLVLHVQTHN